MLQKATILLIALAALSAPVHAQFGGNDNADPANTGFGNTGLGSLSGGFGGAPVAEITAVTHTDAVHAGGEVQVAIKVTIPEGWHINGNKPLDEYLIPTEVRLDGPEGYALDAVVYPEAEVRAFAFAEAMAVYEGEIIIGMVLAVPENASEGPVKIGGILHYQACNDKTCMAPKDVPFKIHITVAPASQKLNKQHEDLFKTLDFTEAELPDAPQDIEPKTDAATKESGDWKQLADKFTIIGSASGFMNAEDFTAFIKDAEAGKAPDTSGGFAGKSLWMVVLLTLVGGLALNLTPCVLPLIPINIAIIGAGAKAGSRSRGFALGGAYGLGITLVYGALGLAVVLTTGSFGTINASPWFNVGISVLFVLLGLAMFDLVAIDFSKYQAKFGIRKNESHSFFIAFAMGCISALLAGACVAPVVIAVVLFSRDLYAQGSPVGLILPFLLGAGMALPWPFAGAGLSFLPKPGMWMTRVKYVFGVFILVFAAYYAREAYSLFSDRMVDQNEVASSAQALDEQGWTHSLAHGLNQADEKNQPVLIDFWATWCKNCMTMNKTTLKDEKVQAALEGYVKIKFQAQDPSDPATKEVLDHFGAGIGLPVYVILQPGK